MEDFENSYVNDVYIIDVNLTRATINEAAAFRGNVEEIINSDHSNIVIDLHQCEFIDSTFFGAIIIILKRIKAKGYKLKVVEPANIGEDIFTTRNFRSLFDLYKTREAAIKSFEGNSHPES